MYITDHKWIYFGPPFKFTKFFNSILVAFQETPRGLLLGVVIINTPIKLEVSCVFGLYLYITI